MASAASPGPSRPPGGLFREEAPALVVVIAAHAALFAALSLFGRAAPPPPIPPRMQVTIANEIAQTSTSPEPAAMPAPEIAPTRGEPAPALLPLPRVQPAPAPVIAPAPAPVPAPRVVPPKPRPATAKPVSHAAAPVDERPRRRPDAPSGASMIGSDFLKGIPGGDTRGTARTPPAAAIGPAVKASLASAIADQLQPHWTAPQGVDAEKLVTVLAWDLNPDGSLASSPRVVSQSGITDANRPQASRHAELAVRAVRLAAPFKLPAQYYAGWKRVTGFRFDRNLSE